MKKIGIIGGMSPESTQAYYQYITRTYVERFGDYSYPEILIYSVSFQEFRDWQESADWDASARKMAEVADALQSAGADFGAIATNTMHIVYDDVARLTSLPLISIVDTTAQAIANASITRVGLLGTKFTMCQPFFRKRLRDFGIETVIPASEDDQDYVTRVIFEELCRGVFRDEARDRFGEIINGLKRDGAGAVIFGCTEIPLLLANEDYGMPLFDTTALHAERLLQEALD